MSAPDDPQAPEGDDMLAAEYVLGTLPLPDRLAVQRRLRDDMAFAARTHGRLARCCSRRVAAQVSG